jgi:hypothetical protein
MTCEWTDTAPAPTDDGLVEAAEPVVDRHEVETRREQRVHRHADGEHDALQRQRQHASQASRQDGGRQRRCAIERLGVISITRHADEKRYL